VLDLNERAIQRMHCVTRLHVVPGATHLFEEPGALEQVAEAAGSWFVSHMGDRLSVVREAGTRRRRSG
jgi:hypothetical protein